MSSRYKVHDPQAPYFVTSTVVGWIDVFSRELYKEILCKSLLFCQDNKGLRLHAWVIMSNHIHLIISAAPGFEIGHIMRDFKKFTSKKIIAAINANEQESWKKWMLNMFSYAGQSNNSNEENQFWQQEYHPQVLDSEEKRLQKLNYLHTNPVRAGYVWLPEHHKYSSAIDYYLDKTGILPIERLHVC